MFNNKLLTGRGLIQLLMAVVSILIIRQIVVYAEAPHRSATNKESGFDRPGKPVILDSVDGHPELKGPGHGIKFSYDYPNVTSTWPSSLNGGFPNHYGSFTPVPSKIHQPGGASGGPWNVWGKITLKKDMGVYYKCADDKGNAERTSAHWKFKIEIDTVAAGWYCPVLSLPSVNPTCEVKFRVDSSLAGTKLADITLKASRDQDTAVGFGPFSAPIDYSNGAVAPAGNTLVSVDVPSTGGHPASSEYKVSGTVTSTATISAYGQHLGAHGGARAWGWIKWDTYMATGGDQVKYKFPAPISGHSLIEFRQ